MVGRGEGYRALKENPSNFNGLFPVAKFVISVIIFNTTFIFILGIN